MNPQGQKRKPDAEDVKTCQNLYKAIE